MNSTQSKLLLSSASSRTTMILGLTLAIWILTPIFCGEALSSDPSEGKNVVELNRITVNKINKEIRIKVKLAIEEGILEYLLVDQQGKTYESVFKVVDNKPSELNFALLLIGCKPLNFDKFVKLISEKKTSPEHLKGDEQSLLEIQLYSNGERVPLNRLVKNREGSGKPLLWVYTGGYFAGGNRYAGDTELSHIGFWPDPSAVINLFSSLGNPYQGDFGFEMNKENKMLKVDQDFEIVIRRQQL